MGLRNSFYAPAKFLGDQTAAYGGTLHLDEKADANDGKDYPLVVISDGTTMLQYWSSPPGTGWTSFDVPLLAGSGWEISDGNGSHGALATTAELQTVLSSLSFIHIIADWRIGAGTVDLDNVRLRSLPAVPEPQTWSLLFAGLGLIGAIVRRRAA